MSPTDMEICRQIKAAIDQARQQGVCVNYPTGVWIDDEYWQWPFRDKDKRIRGNPLITPVDGDINIDPETARVYTWSAAAGEWLEHSESPAYCVENFPSANDPKRP